MNRKKYLIRILSCLAALVISVTALSSCSFKKSDDGYEKLELIDSLFRAYTLFDLDEEALMRIRKKRVRNGLSDLSDSLASRQL